MRWLSCTAKCQLDLSLGEERLFDDSSTYSAAEIDAIAALAAESVRGGAFGVSCIRNRAHRDRQGQTRAAGSFRIFPCFPSLGILYIEASGKVRNHPAALMQEGPAAAGQLRRPRREPPHLRAHRGRAPRVDMVRTPRRCPLFYGGLRVSDPCARGTAAAAAAATPMHSTIGFKRWLDPWLLQSSPLSCSSADR